MKKITLLCLSLIGLNSFAQAPANDDPAGATALSLDTTLTATNENATDSSTGGTPATPPGACGGYSGGDVWFTIQTDINGDATVETSFTAASSVDDTVLAVYSGTAASLTFLACDDDSALAKFSRVEITGETPNSTLFVRVWEFNNDQVGEFNITALTVAPIANDLPSGAISLTLGSDFNENAITTNNLGATDSFVTDNTIPVPGCANYQGDDIWFTVETDTNGEATIETASASGSAITDTGIAVYSGTAASLTLVECDDDDSTGLFSKIELTGRAVGETLFVRAWVLGNTLTDEFMISAYSSPVLSIVDNTFDQLSYYPNPVVDQFTVNGIDTTISGAKVYNSSGQLVLTQNSLVENTVELVGVESGLYFIELTTNTGSKNLIKVIKQ